ncbi:MAG: cysteine--tRNA ligase [Euryarchaeota archaeon]|nr:cysteine--tRNA ligase [Euryarchaeota archaeon]
MSEVVAESRTEKLDPSRGVRITDSLTNEKVPFVPLEPGRVRMYVCGLTVYDDAHIGHARTYVSFDVIRRYLEYKGFDVRYVQNITDVEDKIIKAAEKAGVSHLEHSRKYTQRALGDLARIGIRDPDAFCKVTDHMDDIVALIEEIIENGLAYVSDSGSVYFDVAKKEGYGKLSNRSVKEMLAGARVEPDPEKRNPADFALWKAAKPDEPHWESPWGKGRPGWHIECSAMSERLLGQPFDLHGGGRDLIFPHHENEIAQSEAAKGTDFAKYWLHTGFLNVEGEKMSKSLGNFITVRELLERHAADAVRYFYVLTHWRSPIDFSEKGITEAAAALERLTRTREELDKRVSGHEQPVDRYLAVANAASDAEKRLFEATERFLSVFTAAMDDDFNTPEAVAALHAFAGDLRKALSDNGHVHKALWAYAHDAFIRAGRVLTLFQDAPAEAAGDKTLDAVMQALLKIRQEARERKDWATSDAIRDRLAEVGIEVQDEKTGATWRRAS